MKYFIFVCILLSIMMSSCDDPTFILAVDVPEYDIDLSIEGDNFNEKIRYIDDWIFSNIIMHTDEEIHGGPYWQTPEETIELKTGDCEDLCILFLWLCYQYLDIKPDMLILRRFGEDHAIAKYHNYIFADYYHWYSSGNYIYTDKYSWEKTLIFAEYVK